MEETAPITEALDPTAEAQFDDAPQIIGYPSAENIPVGKRKGGRPKGAKSPHVNNAEMCHRIEVASLLLSRGMMHSAINKALRDEFKVTSSAAKEYIRAAQELLLRWTDKAPVDHFRESAAFWMGLIASPVTSMADKMNARAHLDQLYGLHRIPAQKLEMDLTSGGKPLKFIVINAPAAREESRPLPAPLKNLEEVQNGEEPPQRDEPAEPGE